MEVVERHNANMAVARVLAKLLANGLLSGESFAEYMDVGMDSITADVFNIPDEQGKHDTTRNMLED